MKVSFLLSLCVFVIYLVMEKILLEVPNSMAKKWQQTSDKLKKQAVEAVKRVLDVPGPTDLTEAERQLHLQEARDFFSKLSADFTDYKFDRDEANER